MASVTRSGDTVTLTLTTAEALYVTAELGGGNSYWHGLSRWDSDDGVLPYTALVEALRVGGERRGPLAAEFRKHQRVSEATRPEYDNTAGRLAAERQGFQPALVEAV